MKVAVLPLHEELDALARHYHHLQVEHQNAQPESSNRRRLEEKLLRVRERLERVLEEWVPDGQLREAWRTYLDHHGPEADGGLIERVAAEKDFSSPEPVVRYRLNENEYDEIFAVSDEALQALAEFLDRGDSPPWEHASELLADGLIDVHFALTPRGHRALAGA